MFPHCFGEDCISIDYRIIGKTPNYIPPFVKYTMDYIKAETGLEDSDFRSGPNIAKYQDLQSYYNYHVDNRNKTQIGLLFCDGESKDFWLGMFYCNGSDDYAYFMVMNKSESLSVVFHDVLEPLPIDQVSSSLKVNHILLSFQQIMQS